MEYCINSAQVFFLRALSILHHILSEERQQCLIISIKMLIAELHPHAKRARGRSPIAKEVW